jgi:hypothetical protein
MDYYEQLVLPGSSSSSAPLQSLKASINLSGEPASTETGGNDTLSSRSALAFSTMDQSCVEKPIRSPIGRSKITRPANRTCEYCGVGREICKSYWRPGPGGKATLCNKFVKSVLDSSVNAYMFIIDVAISLNGGA